MEIAFLAARPQAIPSLAAWFIAGWPEYYGKRTTADVEKDFRECLNTQRLPIGLIAYDDDAPCGVIVLRESAMTDLPQYSPGLGAFYVAASHRNRGIGTQLVRMGTSVAQALEHRAVYATTARTGKIFVRLGWRDMGTVLHRGQALTLYRWQADGEHFGAPRGLKL